MERLLGQRCQRSAHVAILGHRDARIGPDHVTTPIPFPTIFRNSSSKHPVCEESRQLTSRSFHASILASGQDKLSPRFPCPLTPRKARTPVGATEPEQEKYCNTRTCWILKTNVLTVGSSPLASAFVCRRHPIANIIMTIASVVCSVLAYSGFASYFCFGTTGVVRSLRASHGSYSVRQ